MNKNPKINENIVILTILTGISILWYMGTTSEHPLTPGFVRVVLLAIIFLCFVLLLRNVFLSKYKTHFGFLLILTGIVLVYVLNF
ncbi:hypothetical protein Pan241w_34890 [Gimesia alba]|uniref:Uncharacterized protein n=1 Tax=Gimesia alba TaxID=2527973 RepID=A0A517RHN7_9PLAN|nr:hypothetical protein Pan241w_34890 [Gimesia alba]